MPRELVYYEREGLIRTAHVQPMTRSSADGILKCCLKDAHDGRVIQGDRLCWVTLEEREAVLRLQYEDGDD